MRFLKIGEAAKELKICQQTLRKYIDQDKIPHKITPGGQRLVDVDAYLEGKTKRETDTKDDTRVKIFYCRVSSKKQSDDLERQAELARKEYPNHEIIKDVGSGINWKRRGFQSLLARVSRQEVEEIIVFHRDRISRFGYDLVETICHLHDTILKVHDKSEIHKSSEEELAEDLMAIISNLSYGKMGKGKYKFKNISVEVHEDLPDEESKGVI
jgi:predicted site-specific integrase-resolvase